MVDLVEETRRRLGGHVAAHEVGQRCDLGIRDDHAVEARRHHPVSVGPVRGELHAAAGDAVGPLALEALGGHHDDDEVGPARAEMAAGDGAAEVGLARAWRGHDQEVPGHAAS